MLSKEQINDIKSAVNHPSKVDTTTFEDDQARAGRDAVSSLGNGLLLIAGDRHMDSSVCVSNPHLFPILFREVLKQINERYGVNFDLNIEKGYIYESVAHELGHVNGCVSAGLSCVMGIQVIMDEANKQVGVVPFVRMDGITSKESVIKILQDGERYGESELSTKDVAMIDILKRT